MCNALVMAALAFGSGDGRNGATNGRTVEKVPPHTLLRVGMTSKEVSQLMGRCDQIGIASLWSGLNKVWNIGPDEFGRYHRVLVNVDEDGRVASFQVDPDDPRPRPKMK